MIDSYTGEILVDEASEEVELIEQTFSIHHADRALLASLMPLTFEDVETPLPAPLPPLRINAVTIHVPVRISAGVWMMTERRVIRSNNPNTPTSERTRS